MSIAAASNTSTVLDRLGHIPMDFWLKFGLGVVAIVAAVVVLRKLAQVNKVVLAVVTGVFVTVLGFSWIYERNEPNWASPAVTFLADFLPTKGKVTGGH